MAVTSISSSGLVAGSLAEYIEAIEARYKDSDIYGANFRTGAGSVCGMHARLKAELLHDLAAVLAYAVAMGDPNQAEGVFLSEIVAFNSIYRNEEENSTVTISFTAEASGTEITADNTIVSDGQGASFVPLSTQVIGASATVDVPCVAVDAGPVVAVAGTLTTIDKRPYGLASATNVLDAVVGRYEETDPDLKIRRRQAATVTCSASKPGIERALRDINGVTDVGVFLTTGKYLRAVVEGGTDADIAQTLHRTVAAGTLYEGTTLVNHSENGQIDPIRFYRVVEKPIYITFVIEKRAGYGGDTLVKERTVELFLGTLEVEGENVQRPQVGENVIGSKISIGADSVPNCYVREIRMDFAANPTDTDDLSIEFWQRASTSLALVDVIDA